MFCSSLRSAVLSNGCKCCTLQAEPGESTLPGQPGLPRRSSPRYHLAETCDVTSGPGTGHLSEASAEKAETGRLGTCTCLQVELCRPPRSQTYCTRDLSRPLSTHSGEQATGESSFVQTPETGNASGSSSSPPDDLCQPSRSIPAGAPFHCSPVPWLGQHATQHILELQAYPTQYSNAAQSPLAGTSISQSTPLYQTLEPRAPLFGEGACNSRPGHYR